jgi:desampylase
MLTFGFEAINAIRSHVEGAGVEEVGGLLAARDGVIGWALEAANDAPDPRAAFWIDPRMQWALIDHIHRHDFELAGTFHSHPSGNPHMSSTDATMAAGTGVLLIVAPGPRWHWSLWDPTFGGEVDFTIAAPWSV